MADENITVGITVQGDAAKAFKKLTVEVKQFGEQTEKNVKKATSAFDVFKGVIGAEAVVSGFRAITQSAQQLFNVFIAEGVTAAQAQEDAVNELNIALARSGEFSEEASQDIQDWASSLQSATTVGDETALSLFALSKSFGFTAEGAKEATEAALELAAAAGISLEEATRRVGRTISGSIEDVSKFAPAIKNLTKEQLAAGEAARELIRSLGGTAAGQINTFSGATQQLANNFGDLQEQFGFTITRNEAFIAAIKVTTETISDLSNFVASSEGEFNKLAGQGLILAIDTFNLFIDTIDATNRTISILFNTGSALLKGFALPFVGAMTLASGALLKFKELTGKATEADLQAFAQFKRASFDLADSINKDVQQIEDAVQGDSFLSKFSDGLDKASTSAEENLGKISTAAQDAIKNTDKVNAANEKLLANQKKLAEEGRRIVDEQQDPVEIFAKRQEALVAALELEKITREEFQATLDVAKAERDQKELDDLLARNELLRNVQSEEANKQIEQNQRRIDAIVAQNQGLAKREIAIRKRAADEKRKVFQREVQFTGQALGNIATLTASNNKKLFNIGKAAAIGQATTNAIVGVSNALAGPPTGPTFPLNIILAATQAVRLATQVSQLASQQPPGFQEGLTAVPAGFPNDTFAARLTSGERVVSAPQNEDLTNFLSANQGQSVLLAEISSKLDALGAVVVNVGGEEIVNVLRDELDSGRVLEVS